MSTPSDTNLNESFVAFGSIVETTNRKGPRKGGGDNNNLLMDEGVNDSPISRYICGWLKQKQFVWKSRVSIKLFRLTTKDRQRDRKILFSNTESAFSYTIFHPNDNAITYEYFPFSKEDELHLPSSQDIRTVLEIFSQSNILFPDLTFPYRPNESISLLLVD